jgi:hypothetical protein
LPQDYRQKGRSNIVSLIWDVTAYISALRARAALARTARTAVQSAARAVGKTARVATALSAGRPAEAGPRVAAAGGGGAGEEEHGGAEQRGLVGAVSGFLRYRAERRFKQVGCGAGGKRRMAAVAGTRRMEEADQWSSGRWWVAQRFMYIYI